MIKKLTIFASLVLPLSACSSGGSQFEGTWHCDTDAPMLGDISIPIKHANGDVYIVEWPMAGKLNFTYSDGKLVGPRNITLTVDDDTGELVGIPVCMMKKKA